MNKNDYRVGDLVEYENETYVLYAITPDFPFLNTTKFGLGVVGWDDIKFVSRNKRNEVGCFDLKEKCSNYKNGYCKMVDANCVFQVLKF